MIRYTEIKEQAEKSRVCDAILRALPEWFGIEASIVSYGEEVRRMPFFAAIDGEKAVGFAALKLHNADTAEICVMGILPAYHRQGIGARLVTECEGNARERGMTFLTVKTLDASRESKGYEKTRLFYQAQGFKPLEVFPLLWDEANPCLFLAKYIGNGTT